MDEPACGDKLRLHRSSQQRLNIILINPDQLASASTVPTLCRLQSHSHCVSLRRSPQCTIVLNFSSISLVRSNKTFALYAIPINTCHYPPQSQLIHFYHLLDCIKLWSELNLKKIGAHCLSHTSFIGTNVNAGAHLSLCVARHNVDHSLQHDWD